MHGLSSRGEAYHNKKGNEARAGIESESDGV